MLLRVARRRLWTSAAGRPFRRRSDQPSRGRSASSRREQLVAGGVRAPLLVLLGRPTAFGDEQLPEGRVVDRPEDVRGAFDVEARSELVLLVEALDHGALIRVVLGPDPVPESLISGSVTAPARITSTIEPTRCLPGA